MENIWLSLAKRLQSIATTGIEFTKDGYDKERYEEISSIALLMLSDISCVPIARIEGLVSPHAKTHQKLMFELLFSKKKRYFLSKKKVMGYGHCQGATLM